MKVVDETSRFRTDFFHRIFLCQIAKHFVHEERQPLPVWLSYLLHGVVVGERGLQRTLSNAAAVRLCAVVPLAEEAASCTLRVYGSLLIPNPDSELNQLGPPVGIRLNWVKCMVYMAPHTQPLNPQDFPLLSCCPTAPLQDAVVLNVPLFPNPQFWAEHVREVDKCHARIASFALYDRHSAYWLLQACAGPALSTYLARCAPIPPDIIDQLDLSAARVWSACGPSLSGPKQLRASLPAKRLPGGLGLRPMARITDIALACGIGVAHKSMQYFFSGPVPQASALDPTHLDRVSSLPGDAASIVLAGIASGKGVGLQRKAIAAVEEHLAKTLFQQADTEERIRILSCSHPRANYYLSPPQRAHALCWLDPAAFDAVIRLRLGVPLSDVESSCDRCHAPVKDVNGTHLLACMAGSLRSELHTEISQTAFSYATRGGLQPFREGRPFSSAPGARLDIGFISGGQSHLLDFAVTSHLRPIHLAQAAQASGGAATAYEDIKRNKYGAFIRPGQVLHPVCFDTLGAWGAAAAKPLYIIASKYAGGSGLGPSAMHLFYAHLNAVIMKNVARILLGHSAAGTTVLCD